MQLPTLICFALAAGLLTALAARPELRGSPKAPLSTSSFRAFLAWVLLLLVPSSLYFYLFHGDWFLLYLVDVSSIPSALTLVGFVLEVVIACAGFAIGGYLVRAQQDAVAFALPGMALALGVLAGILAARRFGVVGSFEQYHGNYGLVPLSGSPLLPGLVLLCTLLVVGFVALLVRLGWGARRTV